MSPVVQQGCVAGGCVVGQGDRSPVQQLEGNLGEAVSLLQFFAHFYSSYVDMAHLEMRDKYTMPAAAIGCVVLSLDTGVSRIAASIAVAVRPVNNQPRPNDDAQSARHPVRRLTESWHNTGNF